MNDTVPAYRCAVCGHLWVPRRKEPPRQCPRCRSTYWRGKRCELCGDIHDTTYPPLADPLQSLVRAYVQSHPGQGTGEIGPELGLTPEKARKVLESLYRDGFVDRAHTLPNSQRWAWRPTPYITVREER